MAKGELRNAHNLRAAIVAAPKSGTSALHRYVGSHPAIQTHVQMEFSYFRSDTEYRGGWRRARRVYFNRNDTRPVLIKNSGLANSSLALCRLQRLAPGVKIMMILRDPADRLFSSYEHEVRHGAEKNTDFDSFLGSLLKGELGEAKFRMHVEYSLYDRVLRNVYRFFPREQVLALSFRDMLQAGPRFWSTVFGFIEVDPNFTPDTTKRHNESTLVRSPLVAACTNVLLRESMPYKALVRRLVGEKRSYRLGQSLRRVNWKTGKRRMSDQARTLLDAYFRPTLLETNDLLQQDFNW